MNNLTLLCVGTINQEYDDNDEYVLDTFNHAGAKLPLFTGCT